MKFNFKNFLILTIGIITFILFVTDWVIALVYSGTFTVYGIVVNLIEMAISTLCFDYLENYIEINNIK